MLKKLLILITLLTGSIANAGGLYLGAGLGVTTNTSTNSSFRGASANVAFGYGTVIKESFYIGGEVFSNLLTVSLDNNPGATSMRTTYGYGLSILPGYMLSERTMAFVRAGLIRTRFGRPNSTVTGGQVGLGLQPSVTQNWDVRGEYDFVSYQKVTGVTPRADQFNVALVYKFE